MQIELGAPLLQHTSLTPQSEVTLNVLNASDHNGSSIPIGSKERSPLGRCWKWYKRATISKDEDIDPVLDCRDKFILTLKILQHVALLSIGIFIVSLSV